MTPRSPAGAPDAAAARGIRRLIGPVRAHILEDPTVYAKLAAFRCGDARSERAVQEVEQTATRLVRGTTTMRQTPLVIEDEAGRLLGYISVHRRPPLGYEDGGQRPWIADRYIIAFGRDSSYRDQCLRDNRTRTVGAWRHVGLSRAARAIRLRGQPDTRGSPCCSGSARSWQRELRSGRPTARACAGAGPSHVRAQSARPRSWRRELRCPRVGAELVRVGGCSVLGPRAGRGRGRRDMAGAGFEPAKAEPTRLQRVPFDRSGTPPGAVSVGPRRRCSRDGPAWARTPRAAALAQVGAPGARRPRAAAARRAASAASSACGSRSGARARA